MSATFFLTNMENRLCWHREKENHMTDFVADLTSTVAWRRREAQEAATKLLAGHDHTLNDGVIRWASNNRVPPTEWYVLAAHLGLGVDVEKCAAARDEDIGKFVSHYRRAQASRTPEQIAEERHEARAAHGEGVRLVNLLTGESFIT